MLPEPGRTEQDIEADIARTEQHIGALQTRQAALENEIGRDFNGDTSKLESEYAGLTAKLKGGSILLGDLKTERQAARMAALEKNLGKAEAHFDEAASALDQLDAAVDRTYQEYLAAVRARQEGRLKVERQAGRVSELNQLIDANRRDAGSHI